jgi:hypothetical protein
MSRYNSKGARPAFEITQAFSRKAAPPLLDSSIPESIPTEILLKKENFLMVNPP